MSDSLSNNLQGKTQKKKLVEIDIDFGKGVNTDMIDNNFRGMHVVDKDIKFNNITGEAQGKGKVKLRINENDESTIINKISNTPNLKCNLVDNTDKYNKKTDFASLSSTKWNANTLAQESKHYKEKEVDSKLKFLKEFNESSIFGDNKIKNYQKD